MGNVFFYLLQRQIASTCVVIVKINYWDLINVRIHEVNVPRNNDFRTFINAGHKSLTQNKRIFELNVFRIAKVLYGYVPRKPPVPRIEIQKRIYKPLQCVRIIEVVLVHIIRKCQKYCTWRMAVLAQL